jgi:hypothetical protein
MPLATVASGIIHLGEVMNVFKLIAASIVTLPWLLGITAILNHDNARDITSVPALLPKATAAVAPEPQGTPAQFAALELCQYAYLHHYSTAAEYLACTRGLHADESRSTHYSWMSGGVVRTDAALEAQLGR